MKKISLLPLLCILFFVSCQKEDTYPPLTGEKLVRSVSTSNGETTTTNYTYTSTGLIDAVNTTGASDGETADHYEKYYRDATGRIIRIAQKVPAQQGIEIDTVYTSVHYPDASTFNYDYNVQKIEVAGYTINDSTLFTYNSSNQITESYTYETSDLFNSQEIRSIYMYDAAGNIIKIEGYTNATGTMELSATFDIQYDDKTNPLSFDRQIMLITGGTFTGSKNNPILVKFKASDNPDTQTITNTYTFGSNSLPQTLTTQDDLDNSTTTTTFYYE
jgi:hypothetical protein